MKDFLKMVFGSCLGVILASVVVFFIFFAMVGAAIGSFMSGFTEGKTPPKVGAESVLLLDIKGNISDTSISTPFSSWSDEERTNYTLPEILKALEVARKNPKIEAVVVNLENAVINFASAKELRDALKEVQSAGKMVYAYSDHYSYLGYYISSVADMVMGGPEGSLNIAGLSSSTLFTKGLLKKLGVEMQVFKVGTFKGAVEPYILDGLSDANRTQIREFISGLWEGTTAEMSESRGVDASVFQKFADDALFMDKVSTAREMGLLDTLVYRVDLDKVLAEQIYGDPDVDIDYVRVESLLPLYGSKNNPSNIALIYAEGDIIVSTGEDDSNPFATDKFITEQVVKQLREAAEDDDIKAVVMRVNSGGGAVTTSELICHELEQLKAKKPVVISMGDYAASGGYYISSHASAIVANPYTLTGSIGIFGMIPNASGALQKLGLKEETVSTSAAGQPSIIKPLSPQLATKMQETIEKGYDQFITRVATGRAMTKEQVDSVGQGRVWLGAKAIELGLVDKLGGLDDAIQEAARLAELDNYGVVVIKDTTDWWMKLLGMNYAAAVKYITLSGEERMLLHAEEYIKQVSGVKAYPPYDLTHVGVTASQTYPPSISM